MLYRLLKYVVLGPVLRLLFRPEVRGLRNVPSRGPVLLAANHLSFIDSMFIALVVPRRVVFLGKEEYFERPLMRLFLRIGRVIPVRRDGGLAAEAAVRAAVEALRAGEVVGIYPEGTRSPDGRLYRAKVGVARMTLLAGCPVVPVALIGTRGIQPPGRLVPRPSGRVRILFGRPLTFGRYRGRERDRFALRAVADEIMVEIALRSGQHYVDEYAPRAHGSRPRASRETTAAASR